MKRRRRVEIRVERHELSIYASSPQNATRPAADATRNPIVDSAMLRPAPRGSQPEACPICGSLDMLLLADAIALSKGNAVALKDGLEAGIYHLHCSRSGEWWVCGQSLTPG